MTSPTTPGQILGYARAAQPTRSNVKPPAGGAGKSKTGGSSGRRIVRTAAGAARYHVPIGSEIRPARNEASKRFQNNKPARQRYQNLVGRDSKKQAAELKKLNRTQLTRLTALAWSFKSRDANVTRLRTALTKELYNRGINVRTYLAEVGVRGKSLGRGSAFRHSKDKQGRPMPGTVEDKAAKAAAAKPKPKKRKPGGPARGRSGATAPVRRAGPPPKSRTAKRVGSAAVKSTGRAGSALGLSNVDQLRKAVKAFGRVRPESRQTAARFIIRQAVELSAVHVLGDSVIEAANLPPQMESQVIELAGRWRHGYIPLDATAMRIKMKGGHGKPWWSGGKTKRRGNKDSLRKSIAAGNKNRSGKNKVTFHEPVTGKKSDKPFADPATRFPDKEGRFAPSPQTGSKATRIEVPKGRTTVVKSESKPNSTRGAKVNKPEPRTYLRSGMGSGPANQHQARSTAAPTPQSVKKLLSEFGSAKSAKGGRDTHSGKMTQSAAAFSSEGVEVKKLGPTNAIEVNLRSTSNRDAQASRIEQILKSAGLKYRKGPTHGSWIIEP